MKSTYAFMAATALSALALSSCSTTSGTSSSAAANITDLPGIQISTAKSASGLVASLYANDSLSVGYDSLALVLEDAAGNLVTNASVTWRPLEDHLNKTLDTVYGTHSTPLDSAGSAAAKTDGTYRVGGLFVHKGYGSSYRIRVLIARNGTVDSAELVTSLRTVVAKYRKPLSFSAPPYDKGGRQVSVRFPSTPVQGTNPFAIFVGKKTMSSDKDFPCINWPTDTVSWTVVAGTGLTSAKASIVPGDTISRLGNGRFAGAAKFTSVGTWTLALRFTNGHTDSATRRDTVIYLDSIPVN